MNGHSLKLHFYMFKKSQMKHNSLDYHIFWGIFSINCKFYIACHKSKMFSLFKALKPQEWTVLFFQMFFFPTKCAPFILKIREDFNIDD